MKHLLHEIFFMMLEMIYGKTIRNKLFGLHSEAKR